MFIRLKCKCGKRLKISHKSADKKLNCPDCQKPFRVPKAKFLAAAKKAKAKRATDASALPVAHVDDALPTAQIETDEPSGYGDDFLEDLSLSGAVATEPEFDENAAYVQGKMGDVVYAGGVTCPACEKSLPPGTRICVDCGVDVNTGRSLITTDDGRIADAYGKAHQWARWVSWIMPIGIYPFASEAFGTKEPWIIRGTAVVTILITIWVWTADWSDSPKMQSRKQLMMWPASPEPHAGLYQYFLVDEHYGDLAAFDAKYESLAEARRKEEEARNPKPKKEPEPEPASDTSAPTESSEPIETSIIIAEDGSLMDSPVTVTVEPPAEEETNSGEFANETLTPEEEAERQAIEQMLNNGWIDEDDAYFYAGPPEDSDEMDYQLWYMGSDQLRSRLTRDKDLVIQAHNSLPVHQRGAGEFRVYQLFTNAFLHADIMHLGGNLLFLLVFGTRVNAAIGWWRMLIIYPILAVGASLIYLISEKGGLPIPSLGASGAIMGLAGMYMVLFPVHKMHVVGWIRLGIVTGFHLAYRTWEVRGFWVVLFYIAFDVVAVVGRSDDGVAHWAHLGGFLVGTILALLLLIARVVNGRGADLLSVTLGQKAWALIGKPRTA